MGKGARVRGKGWKDTKKGWLERQNKQDEFDIRKGKLRLKMVKDVVPNSVMCWWWRWGRV